MTTKVRVPAYAKLNLGLRVLYRRPDGFHELRTVFQTISLADRLDIEFTPARTTRIEIEGTPTIPDNLVERACRLALEAMKLHAHVRFTLRKTIPMGAGLGGGSSDAAAVLLALPVLARKTLPGRQPGRPTRKRCPVFPPRRNRPRPRTRRRTLSPPRPFRRARTAGGTERALFDCRGVPRSVLNIDINWVTK